MTKKQTLLIAVTAISFSLLAGGTTATEENAVNHDSSDDNLYNESVTWRGSLSEPLSAAARKPA